MRDTIYTLTKAGSVPYHITEEDYKACIKVIEGKRRAELAKALAELYDVFGEIRATEIIDEEMENLGIRYGSK